MVRLQERCSKLEDQHAVAGLVKELREYLEAQEKSGRGSSEVPMGSVDHK
jgi:hypothetical protein